MTPVALLLLALPAEGFRLHALQGRAADPCACLEWQTVYDQNLAQCGDGYEYLPAMQKGVQKELAAQYLEQAFCTDFFRKLNDNECVNLVFDNVQRRWYTGKTWCWVSNGCPMISEIAPDINVHAKIKFCGRSDLSLGHFWPKELVAYSQAHDLDVGLLSKEAYPVEHRYRWDDFKAKVMSMFCISIKDRKEEESMPAAANGTEVESLKTEVESLKAKLDSPYMAKAAILVNDGLPPFGVITLNSVWECWGMEPTKVDYTHPVTESKLYCLCGDCN